jgi:hypoxanthine phosphoribosyltransferase
LDRQKSGATSEFSNPNLEVLISAEELQYRIRELGAELARDYAGRSPIFVGLLNDAMLFVSDLVRSTDIHVDTQFMAVDWSSSSGEVRILKDLDVPIEGRDVLLIDVLIAEGLVQGYLLANLRARGANVKLVSLLDKFERREKNVKIDYLGFAIPDLQLAGYGLGVAGRYRNLPYLAALRTADGERIVPVYEQEDFSATCIIIAPDFELISTELIEYFSTHPDDIYKLDPESSRCS